MAKLQPDAAIPLYQQLCDSLKEKIKNGEYKVGERIPSEEQLIQYYDVSRITVRSAVEHLCEENVLIKRHGKGTFVAAPILVESTSAGNSFTESCRQIGAKPKTKIISNSLQTASLKIAKILGVDEGSKVICINRIRYVNDIPTIYEKDYFRPEFEFLLGKIDDGSLLEFVRKKTGLTTSKFEDLFDVVCASKELAIDLEVEEGLPLLRVTQTVMTDHGVLVYCNEQYICSEEYKYVVKR